MPLSSLARYFLAGVMLRNGIPHTVIALTGRRNLTPFGRDSSPAVNALWAAINFAGGYLLVRAADRHLAAPERARPWPVALEAGALAMSLFMVGYKLTHR